MQPWSERGQNLGSSLAGARSVLTYLVWRRKSRERCSWDRRRSLPGQHKKRTTKHKAHFTECGTTVVFHKDVLNPPPPPTVYCPHIVANLGKFRPWQTSAFWNKNQGSEVRRKKVVPWKCWHGGHHHRTWSLWSRYHWKTKICRLKHCHRNTYTLYHITYIWMTLLMQQPTQKKTF